MVLKRRKNKDKKTANKENRKFLRDEILVVSHFVRVRDKISDFFRKRFINYSNFLTFEKCSIFPIRYFQKEYHLP